MSKARRLRRSRRWARYFNHYGHKMSVVIGGWGAVRAMNVRGQHWHHIRRQGKPFEGIQD